MTANAPASVTCATVHLPSLLLCAQIADGWCRHLMYSLALLQLLYHYTVPVQGPLMCLLYELF